MIKKAGLAVVEVEGMTVPMRGEPCPMEAALLAALQGVTFPVTRRILTKVVVTKKVQCHRLSSMVTLVVEAVVTWHLWKDCQWICDGADGGAPAVDKSSGKMKLKECLLLR